MLEYLEKLDYKVYDRYKTVEKNIRAGSNSFYDSYLDLTEEMIRYSINEFGISFNGRKSVGELLRQDKVRELFTSRLGVSEYIYGKLGDYVLKINSHKHKREKQIEPDMVVSYIDVFYKITSAIAKYKGIEVLPFDEDFFRDSLNSLEKENEELKRQLSSFEEIIEESDLNKQAKDNYMTLFSLTEMENRTLEEQNKELKRRIEELKRVKDSLGERIDNIDARLQRVESTQSRAIIPSTNAHSSRDFFLKAKKAYLWIGNKEGLDRKKYKACILYLLALATVILESVFATVYFGYLSTFSFFELIWLFSATFAFIYVMCAKLSYSTDKYIKRSIEEFSYDEEGIYKKTGKIKARYKVAFVLNLISVIAHSIIFISDGFKDSGFAIFIIELCVAILTIEFVISVRSIFDGYIFLYIEGIDGYGRRLTLIYDPTLKKYISKDDFKEKYKRLSIIDNMK